MKDEIKEIIKLNCDEEIEVKYFAKNDSLVYTTMDYSQLLDYITTLQEENQRLREHILRKDKVYSDLEDKYITLKARKDKAIEYIKNNLCKDNNGCGCWWYSFEYYVEAKKELLEMLQGDDNNAKD